MVIVEGCPLIIMISRPLFKNFLNEGLAILYMYPRTQAQVYSLYTDE